MSCFGLIVSQAVFNDATDDYNQYIELLGQYFRANHVSDEKNVAVLSVIGSKIYKLKNSDAETTMRQFYFIENFAGKVKGTVFITEN